MILRRVSLTLTVLVLLLLDPSIAGPRALSITLGDAHPDPGMRVRTPDETLRLVARITTDELGLPLPDSVTAYLYGSRRLFQDGLVEHAGIAPALAAEFAEFAHGASVPGAVLLLDTEEARRPWREWPRLVAHGLAHVSQSELTGVDNRPGAAVAQTAQDRLDGRNAGSIAREWELRGVAIADPGPVALVEHRPSGRQQFLRVGDILAGGVAVAAIAADRIVLHSAGRAVTLRLGHGGQARVLRPGIPVRRAWPPSLSR